jgi:hypothetical protein
MKFFSIPPSSFASTSTLLLAVTAIFPRAVFGQDPTTAPTLSPPCDWELSYYGTAESTGTACDGTNATAPIKVDGACNFHPNIGYYEALCSDVGGALVIALAHCQEGCVNCEALSKISNFINNEDSFITPGDLYNPGICYFLTNPDNIFRPITHAWSVKGDCDNDTCEINSKAPTPVPTESPSQSPSDLPSATPSQAPTDAPSSSPSHPPSNVPTSDFPSMTPSQSPSDFPTSTPSQPPTDLPSLTPSLAPTETPSHSPSDFPTTTPSQFPSDTPSASPSAAPTISTMPTTATMQPSTRPSDTLSTPPTSQPTLTTSPTVSSSGARQQGLAHFTTCSWTNVFLLLGGLLWICG